MNLKLLISDKEIQKAIHLIAKTLNKKYKEKDPVIIAVLKGSICFLADLIRELQFSFSIEFIQAQSYGMRGVDPGSTKIRPHALDISKKDVILLDDILDRGETLFKIRQEFIKQKPSSITTVVLLQKQKKTPPKIVPDYTLLEVEDSFVIGYGLDYKEHYRGLKGIYALM